jgi:flagellar export protein FliJ
MDRQSSKIQRLIELRQRDVDSELSHLAAARREVTVAETDLSQVRLELQQALEERRQMAFGEMDVNQWRTQEEWLDTLALRKARAANQVAAAKIHERRAAARVALAHKKKKQAEMLMDRLLRAHQLEATRLERKQEDELTQRHAMRQGSKGES